MKKFIMEFLGTFFLVLTLAITGSPLAIATMLMAWIYIGGYVSGAHYNPAITLAVALRGRLSWEQTAKYMVGQILGAIAAFAFASFVRDQIMIPTPGDGVSLMQALAIEILLSFVLALVVLAVATSNHYKNSQVFGFAIGFTLLSLAVIGGPISGGLFNPAISLGASIFGAIKGASVVWNNLAMYVGGASLGGALAAYAFDHLIEK